MFEGLVGILATLVIVWVAFGERKYIVYDNRYDEPVKACHTYWGAEQWVKYQDAQDRTYIRYER